MDRGDGIRGRALRKVRNVGSARNTQPQIFGSSLVLKVRVETVPQLPCVVTDDVVFGWVVLPPAPKDVNSNLLFANLLGPPVQSTVADVQKEIGEQRRSGEALLATILWASCQRGSLSS
jgi:hypothetical protein